MNLMKSKGVYLWREGPFDSETDCTSGPSYLQRWPGTTCMYTTQSGTGFDYFAPLTPNSWHLGEDNGVTGYDSRVMNDFGGFSEDNLKLLDDGSGWLTLNNIYQRSLDCAQQSWSKLSDNALHCTHWHEWKYPEKSAGTISSPLQSLMWPNEQSQTPGLNPLESMCHFNLPIVDLTQGDIVRDAWNNWSNDVGLYTNPPSYEDGQVWLWYDASAGKVGNGFHLSRAMAMPNDPCSCYANYQGWQACKADGGWYYS